MALAEPAVGGAPQPARAATGLLATWQSIAWLGTEAGLFKKRDITMSFPALSVGGPEAVAGLVRGDWEFAHVGALPVAEQVLAGRDVVIVAMPTCQFASTFVMTRAGIDDLAKLDGKKVGLVTETGQTSVAARLAIEKAGANSTYVILQTFDNVYAALAAGEVDAGALPVDVRRKGRDQHGWNFFALNEFDTPSVFATTRRLIASNRDLALRVMQGFVETIQIFKTRPDIIVPLLQRYLEIEDREIVEQLHAFHVPLFQDVPRPLPIGLHGLREYLLKTSSNAAALREYDICDASLIDELDDRGFIKGLCTNAPDYRG